MGSNLVLSLEPPAPNFNSVLTTEGAEKIVKLASHLPDQGFLRVPPYRGKGAVQRHSSETFSLFSNDLDLMAEQDGFEPSMCSCIEGSQNLLKTAISSPRRPSKNMQLHIPCERTAQPFGRDGTNFRFQSIRDSRAAAAHRPHTVGLSVRQRLLDALIRASALSLIASACMSACFRIIVAS